MKNRIIQIRKEKKYSQEKFAEELGLSRNFINQVENGKKNFSERTIEDICKAFNVNKEWLVNGTGEPYIEKDDTLENYLGQIAGGNDEFIKAIIMAYMPLDETSKKALHKLAKNTLENLKSGS